MDATHFLILKLALALVACFLGGLVARKLKLSSVLGYLLFGLILEPSLGLKFKNFPCLVTIGDRDS